MNRFTTRGKQFSTQMISFRIWHRHCSEKVSKNRHFYRDIEDDMIDSEKLAKLASKSESKTRPKFHDITFGQLNHDIRSDMSLKKIVNVEYEHNSRSFRKQDKNINQQESMNEIDHEIEDDQIQSMEYELNYISKQLESGINEQIYDYEHDSLVSMFRMFTWTPFTFGILVVPLIISRYPDFDMASKMVIGLIYQCTSLIFPSLAHRAVSNTALKVWITPSKDKLIVEKRGFWFGLYTQQFNMAYLKPLYARGTDRHCWFQCQKSKAKFMLVGEKMEHPVWFELLGIKQHDISTARHHLMFIANKQLY